MSDDISDLMFEAVEVGDIDTVEQYISKYGLNHCVKWGGGYALVSFSLEIGQRWMAMFLLTKVSKVVKKDKYIMVSLHVAVIKKDVEIARILLDKGADVNDHDYNASTPLHVAVKNKDMVMVQMLLDRGADVNALHSNTHKSSLHVAVTNHDTKMARMLLHRGADINASNKYCGTPLHIAFWIKDIEMVQMLLDKGADANACDDSGRTSLEVTIDRDDIFMLQELLDIVCDSSAYKWTENALYYAVKCKRVEMVKILLDKGVDTNALDRSFGKTPLHIAVSNTQFDNTMPSYIVDERKEDIEMIHMLLDKGADVNVKDKDGETPFHIAVKNKDMEIVQILLEKSVIAHDECTQILSRFAVENKHMEIVQILVDQGADVNASNEDGETLLHIAVVFAHENKAAVKYLLEHGACPYLKNIEGKTPHHYVRNPEILEHLLCHDLNNEENSKIVLDLAMGRYDSFGLLKPVIMANHLGYCFDKDSHVLSNNIDYIDEESNEIHYIEDPTTIELECKEEVDRMKEQKIGDSNVNYYEFLRKRTHQLAVCLNNEFIMNTLEQADYKTAYPMYADVINGHFTRGKFRKQLLDKVYERWNGLFPILTDDCAQILLAYLNNQDLKILITALTP